MNQSFQTKDGIVKENKLSASFLRPLYTVTVYIWCSLRHNKCSISLEYPGSVLGGSVAGFVHMAAKIRFAETAAIFTEKTAEIQRGGGKGLPTFFCKKTVWMQRLATLCLCCCVSAAAVFAAFAVVFTSNNINSLCSIYNSA